MYAKYLTKPLNDRSAVAELWRDIIKKCSTDHSTKNNNMEHCELYCTNCCITYDRVSRIQYYLLNKSYIAIPCFLFCLDLCMQWMVILSDNKTQAILLSCVIINKRLGASNWYLMGGIDNYDPLLEAPKFVFYMC